jgi:hypothetical protein
MLFIIVVFIIIIDNQVVYRVYGDVVKCGRR